MRGWWALLAAAGMTATPAAAQMCTRNGYPDPQTTQQLNALIARPDPSVMRQIVGTWYGETPNPATGQIQYGYQTYEANGLFSYRNRVCGGMINTCSDYQGHGRFGGVRLADGSISLVIMYSDLQVTNACIGSVVRMLPNGNLQSATGIARRVR